MFDSISVQAALAPATFCKPTGFIQQPPSDALNTAWHTRHTQCTCVQRGQASDSHKAEADSSSHLPQQSSHDMPKYTNVKYNKVPRCGAKQ